MDYKFNSAIMRTPIELLKKEKEKKELHVQYLDARIHYDICCAGVPIRQSAFTQLTNNVITLGININIILKTLINYCGQQMTLVSTTVQP